MMLRNALILLLAALVLGCQASVGVNVLRGKSSAVVEPSEQRRHLISFWSILFEMLPHHLCPPGPLGEHCHNEEDGEEDENETDDSAANAGASSSGADSYHSAETAGTSTGGSRMSRSTIWLLVVAAVAATAALIAAAVGQRRDKEDLHPLNGAVSRRMNLFTSLADGSLCVSRPPRIV